MRGALAGKKLRDEFEGSDKDKIDEAVQDTLNWLDKKRLALMDEVEAKQKELESVVSPITMKLYRAASCGSEPEAHGSERKGEDSMGNCCFTMRTLAEEKRQDGCSCVHWDVTEKAVRD
eukprot:13503511-Alexandrium_andersonii.AAC.1